MTYQERLRELRKNKGMTTEQIADYLHMPSELYADCENGSAQLPAKYLPELSELYGVSVDYIICVTDRPERL